MLKGSPPRASAWKNNDIAFWIVSPRMMPPIALVVPYFLLFGQVSLLDEAPVLFAVYAAMNFPMAVRLLRDK